MMDADSIIFFIFLIWIDFLLTFVRDKIKYKNIKEYEQWGKNWDFV
jgi:hypothetical protein